MTKNLEYRLKEGELTFQKILKSFLKENALTQTKFAECISVKQSQVSEWLKGKENPDTIF